MLGGEFGGRFFTNGHWMMLVPEDVWQAAVASGWRDVRVRWSDYARLFDGCGIEANVLAFAVVEERNGVRLAKVGSVWMRAEHHALLVELEVVDVVIKDDDVPMLLAPGLAIVSCMSKSYIGE